MSVVTFGYLSSISDVQYSCLMVTIPSEWFWRIDRNWGYMAQVDLTEIKMINSATRSEQVGPFSQRSWLDSLRGPPAPARIQLLTCHLLDRITFTTPSEKLNHSSSNAVNRTGYSSV